jgi:DNA polymerase I-like protein with 3'-5' exonuclease and polymerase domains
MQFDRSRHVAVDFETTGDDPAYGLQPWRVDQRRAFIRAMSVAYYDADGHMKLKGGLDPSRQNIRDLLTHCAQTNRTLVGWNIPFDVSWMLAEGLEDEVWACRWLDAMLLWMHAEREPEYDEKGVRRREWTLEAAVKINNPKHAAFKQIDDFHTTDPVLLERLLVRNKMDAACTLRYAETYWNALADTQQRCATIEAATIPLVARANLRGALVDTEHCKALSTRLVTLADEHLQTLSKFGATPEILASPQQLGKLMYEDWGLPIIKRTEKGQPSTDMETLFELAPSDNRAHLIKEYREANNNNTKFVKKLIESAEYNGDGYTRPSARMYAAYTGRMSYSSKQGKGVKEVQTGFALHQMKNDPDFRDGIDAPPGYLMVEFDAANQEYRLMAIQSGDPVMMQMCQPGEDPHGYMGAQIGRVDYHSMLSVLHDKTDPDYEVAKKNRKCGKFANLSFSYRVGVEKATVTARVKHELDVDENFVGQVKRTYLRTYKRVEPYWNNAIARARKAGYAESLGGRRVQLKGNWNGKLSWSLESTAINFPIQATGADQKYLALACLKPVLSKRGAYFAWELHDGLYFYLRLDNWQVTLAEMNATLCRLPYKKAWDFTPPIPLPWDCKVGSSWGSMKEHKFD